MSTDLAVLVDVSMTDTEWTPLGDMSFEQWESAGAQLQTMGRAWQFWCGDWLNYGEQRFGEKYAQAVETTDFARQTLVNVASIAKRVSPERRRRELSWSHHEAVAALPPAEQDRWLSEAEQEGYTIRRLRSRLSGTAKDAPDPDEQLAPTHVGQIRFKFVAQSGDAAHARVKELAALLERKGVRVHHKTAGEL